MTASNFCLSWRFDAANALRKGSPKTLADEVGSFERVEGIAPRYRQSHRIVRNGIAGDRLARIDRTVDAMERTREHRGDHQVGLGIGARNPVLDPGAGGIAVGHAERGVAVVPAPRRGGGSECTFLEASEGVRIHRTNGHGIVHRREEAAIA